MIMHSLIFPFMLLLSAIFSFEKWSFFYISPIRSGMTWRMRKDVRDDVGDEEDGLGGREGRRRRTGRTRKEAGMTGEKVGDNVEDEKGG